MTEDKKVEIMSTENALDLFARLRLAPFIKEAVQAAVVARPADTIDFIIQFLTKNRDKLQRGLMVEAIDYVNAGGRLENEADEVLLKQYDMVKVRHAACLLAHVSSCSLLFCQKKLDAVTNVGRAEVARLKELNTQSKLWMKQHEQELESANKELETARARIAELEAQLAAAASIATAAADPEPVPAKSVVTDDRSDDASPESAPAPHHTEIQQEMPSRSNPFHALGDIGLGDAASRLLALAGAHGYVVLLGADSAEGEPSARSQLVENTAAALAAAGVAVAVHKLDITALDDGAAFVVAGDDGSEVCAAMQAELVKLLPLCCDDCTYASQSNSVRLPCTTFVDACSRRPAPSSTTCSSSRRRRQLTQPP